MRFSLIQSLKTATAAAALAYFATASAGDAQAQALNCGKNSELLAVKTSAQCGMCQKTIEGAMQKTKGVQKARLNLDDKKLYVCYKPDKTDPKQIRAAIAAAGYDADDLPAEKKAYQELPSCCKKGGGH